MGFFDNLRNLRTQADEPAPQVSAAFENQFLPNWWMPGVPRVSRRRAMQIAAVARSRNLICGTIGAMPIGRFSRIDNRRLPDIPLQFQPDPDYPSSVTWSYVVDSMVFFGGAYVQIVSTYADGRIQHFRWLDPELITEVVDNNMKIVGYAYDGKELPRSGVGSVVYFPSYEDGVLTRAGNTLATAEALEAAAKRAADEPLPQVVLQNSGVDLPSTKITDLLNAWKNARQSRATAYLNANLDIKTLGFDASQMQLVEARQFHASEIARAMNLPPYFLGAEYASSMTYANVENERRNLIDLTLKPYIVAIENRLAMPDFSVSTTAFRFDLDSFARGNALDRVNVTKTLLETGIIDISEARQMEDLSPRGNENASNI